MTSDISKIFKGNGIFLFAAIVFNNPGSKVVRQTWNSKVFGFEMCTAGMLSMLRPSFAATSSLEHLKNTKLARHHTKED